MATDWRDRRDPEPSEIQAMCLGIQEAWSRRERRRRQSGIDLTPTRWSVKQYLVHHAESGHWIGGTSNMVQVWRCVDGR